MCSVKIKYRSFACLCFILALIFHCPEINSQNKTKNRQRVPDTLNAIFPARDSISLNPSDTVRNESTALIAPRIPKDRTMLMFDSLKVKTSRNLITKKIFDLLIVSREPVNKKQITGTSDFNFLMHSGKTIRKIVIMRLNVFGTNINAPLYYEANGIQAILNKTHINTNEAIIRRSLLFSEGDKISALTLSDNERLLRSLPFIDDARIIVLPFSEKDADIVVITKDVYSIGGNASFKGIKAGRLNVFDRNLLGMGHEMDLRIPYDARASNSPGFGVDYTMNNIMETFLKLKLSYYNGFNYVSMLSEKSYGLALSRDLISSTTKYAGGISVNHMTTLSDLDSLPVPEPVKYNLQDYWLARSFLIDRESVTRIILGGRYKNNNVFDRPYISPYSHYNLQKYRIFLGSISLSTQKFYKTNLIYSYGRTEDIPYGGMLRLTVGKEANEFKERMYYGADVSLGKSSHKLGYFYATIGLGSFYSNKISEQGVMNFNVKYFSNLWTVRDYMMRNFVNINYTRGFDRYTDESIGFSNENGLSGFRNDSIKGGQRVTVSLESVLFSPVNFYGFRFAFFAFADASVLAKNPVIENSSVLSGIGLGIRIRNNNLLINTFQVRLGFFPNLPAYSSITHLSFSGEQLLRPKTFEPGPPSIIPYR